MTPINLLTLCSHYYASNLDKWVADEPSNEFAIMFTGKMNKHSKLSEKYLNIEADWGWVPEIINK